MGTITEGIEQGDFIYLSGTTVMQSSTEPSSRFRMTKVCSPAFNAFGSV